MPSDSDGAKHVQLEYVALASNVARHVRDGIDAPGTGYPRDRRPAGHDPIPAEPYGGPHMFPDGQYFRDCVAVFLNARNPYIYLIHKELEFAQMSLDFKHTLVIVRLHPWLVQVSGTWISNGSMSAYATAWQHGQKAVDEIDPVAATAEWWTSWDPMGNRLPKSYLHSATQAVLMVPQHVAPEAMAEILVPDFATESHVRAAMTHRPNTGKAIAVRVDASRFFKKTVSARFRSLAS
jgi:hypothetical protein